MGSRKACHDALHVQHLASGIIVLWLLCLTWYGWRSRREARLYQLTSNTRHNDLAGMLREMGKQVGWDDSRARTMHLDPEEMAKLRKTTGRRHHPEG